MPKKSHKQEHVLLSNIKGKLYHAKVDQLKAIDKILSLPGGVAIAQESTENYQPEERNIVVTFSEYKEKICEIGKLDENLSIKLVDNLKKLTSNKQSQVRNILTITPVYNQNEYAKLYNGLSKDVLVDEIHYDTIGRIFGHFAQNYFSIIAITAVTHFDTH